MRKYIRLPLIIVCTLCLFGLATNKLQAAPFNPLDQACQGVTDSGVCDVARTQKDKNPLTDPNGLIPKAVKIVAGLVGIASVIMVVLGGFTFVTSAGNPEKTAAARKRIIYALVGLAIAALAWTITSFLTKRIL